MTLYPKRRQAVIPLGWALALFLCARGAGATTITDPLIWEIFYDEIGRDTGSPNLFIEIWTASASSLRLEAVNGADGEIYASLDLGRALGEAVPAQPLVLIATGPLDVPPGVFSIIDPIADLQNGPDALRLLDSSTGKVLDLVGYGSPLPANLFEGRPAGDAPQGFSLTRSMKIGDTNDNFFDFAIAHPTPGVLELASSVPVPEPSTLWLALTGLLVTAVVGRTRRPHL